MFLGSPEKSIYCWWNWVQCINEKSLINSTVRGLKQIYFLLKMKCHWYVTVYSLLFSNLGKIKLKKDDTWWGHWSHNHFEFLGNRILFKHNRVPSENLYYKTQLICNPEFVAFSAKTKYFWVITIPDNN